MNRALLVAAIAALLGLAACADVGVPRAGEPVALPPDRVLVFGRIRMSDAKTGTEYAPFKFDPWDQPFFIQGPRLTVELRQVFAPGGTFRYKTHPSPAIGEDGAFEWILAPGEYVIAGNPRLYGSENFTDAETLTLAQFSVPPAGGALYAGTLVIRVVFDLEELVRAQRRDEAEYAITGFEVLDERAAALTSLRARHPALPDSVTTALMRAE